MKERFASGRRRPRGGIRWALAAIVIAVALWYAPLPADLVEQQYASRFYLSWERLVAPLANAVPISLFDALCVIVAGGLLLRVWRLARRAEGGRWRAMLRAVVEVAGVAALIATWFVLGWGLNYRRVPLRERLDHDQARVTQAAAIAMTRTAVSEMNRLHPIVHAAPWPSTEAVGATIAPAFATVQRLVGPRLVAGSTPDVAVGGLPKSTIFQPYFAWAAIDGMTDPFFLETLVNAEVLPIERPFVVAHEWSHLAGYAHESEANFLGWLIGLHAGPQAQYSSWLAIYFHLASSLPLSERRAIDANLQDGPRRDLRAIVERYERSAPRVRIVAWSIYDRFLKANRVSEGIASYDAVVSLVLGTRFSARWEPQTRSAARAH
jgi:hypothetical protein